jgi:hypothetical protein
MPDSFGGDEWDARNADREQRVAEIVARCSNTYTRFNLSPPIGLRSAAEGWVGLAPDEIATVLRQHLREHGRLYTCGSGCGHFWMVVVAMRKALDAKHPAIDRTELERPRRRPASQVRKVHNASGFPDVLVEGRAGAQT